MWWCGGGGREREEELGKEWKEREEVAEERGDKGEADICLWCRYEGHRLVWERDVHLVNASCEDGMEE